MKTISVDLYTINEVNTNNPKLYKKIIGKNFDINIDHDWSEWAIDYFTHELEAIGFSNVKIEFSGFYSQGDGARFTGNWLYSPCWKHKLQEKKFQPLAELLEAVNEIYKEFSFSITASRSNYYHEKTTGFTFEGDEVPTQEETAIEEACRDAMRHIYRTLEKEYEYLSSEEAIFKTLEANEYYFDPEGNIRN